MGADARASFAYDNERPAHEVFVPAFRMSRQLTTNAEYEVFVREGGYERREFWSEEGWQRREQEGWSHPLYWRREGPAFNERGMFAESPLDPRLPVTGVSWHEAEAFARFSGKRLPTEAEWEKAASWDEPAGAKRRFAWGDSEPSERLCNSGFRLWERTPAGAFPEGASPYGCFDMTGNLWEWTSTPFEGFPGFEPFPYPEYSQEWFDGDHRVLKGGSWATGPSVLRASFRNFFRRHFRIAFAGIRLAEDA
jgi:iron(II)-dependent oxidoreductase